MTELTYLDFDLCVERSAGKYRARVLDSPAGEAAIELSLPFSDLELENLLLRLGRTRATQRQLRREWSEEADAAKAFGGRLFDAVFDGGVQNCLASSLEAAARQGAGLRLRLRLSDAPELADLPWEYLYDRTRNRFLGLSQYTPIVRYLELPDPPRPFAVTPPLRALVMISSPRDYPTLDVDGEWAKLAEALGELTARGQVELDRLDEATLPALERSLRRGEYHVFHFVGHGELDRTTGRGMLLFEGKGEQGQPVSGESLAVSLSNHRPLRLAVLNACEGARASRQDPLAGTAQQLVQQGIPAVIAMQFAITDEAAITFAHELYGAIADGLPVDAALANARRGIRASNNELEWGTPVLYLRSPDARIFRIERERPTNRPRRRPSTPPTVPPLRDDLSDAPTDPALVVPAPDGSARDETPATQLVPPVGTSVTLPALAGRGRTMRLAAGIAGVVLLLWIGWLLWLRPASPSPPVGLATATGLSATSTPAVAPATTLPLTPPPPATLPVTPAIAAAPTPIPLPAEPTQTAPPAPTAAPTAVPTATLPVGGLRLAHVTYLGGHAEGVFGLAIHADEQQLVSTSQEAIVWDVGAREKTERKRYDRHNQETVYAVAWDPGDWDQEVATGSKDCTIQLWDARKGPGDEERHPPLLGHTDAIFSLAWKPGGKYLASGSADGTVRVWAPGCCREPRDEDIRPPCQNQRLPYETQTTQPPRGGAVHALAWGTLQNVSTLMAGLEDGTIAFWDANDVSNLKLGRMLREHTRPVRALAWLSDGGLLASGSEDATVRLWNGRGPTSQWVGEHAPGTHVRAVAWSRDGEILASGSTDGVVKFWRRHGEAAEQVAVLASTTGSSVFALAWARDAEGELLAIGRRSRQVELVRVTR